MITQNPNDARLNQTVKHARNSVENLFGKFSPRWRGGTKCASLFVVVVISTGCVTSTEVTIKQLESPPQLSLSDAKRALLDVLQEAHYGWGRQLEKIKVTADGFSFMAMPEEGKPLEKRSYRFADLSSLAWTTGPTIIMIEVQLGDWHIHWSKQKDADRFMDIITVLRYYNSYQPVADDAAAFKEFQEKARAWRALPVKLPLPEEVQRFRVLAQEAFQEKEFEKAADDYEQGLTVEPLWPQGQFNAALLYGESQMYAQAVIHMKRYLELCPDAKDANAARDKMFLWEGKAKEEMQK